VDEGGCRVIGVSSALTGEGKSLSAVNLAYSTSQLGKRVLLIDCDMRRPSVADKLPIRKTPGLSDYLTGQAPADNLIQLCGIKTDEKAFHAISSGRTPPNPMELLSSAKMEKMVNLLRDKYDYIIMNRAAHNQFTQHSDWHECLKNVKGNMSDTCRFFGLVENKYLFAMLDKQKLFQEVIDNKEIEMVILLPKKYGCSLVTLNKAKKNKDLVKFIDLYNEDISYSNSRWPENKYKFLIKKHSTKTTIEVIQRAHHKIQRFFDYNLPDLEGFKLMPLRKFLRRITPSSSFCVSNTQQDDAISVITIDETKPYTIFDPVQTWKQKELNDFYVKEVMVPIFKDGELVYSMPTVEEIRANCEREFNTLWNENTRFSNPNKYYVDLSQKLWDLKNELLENN
jgi:capsular exopolysaccharide synthesis family protein